MTHTADEEIVHESIRDQPEQEWAAHRKSIVNLFISIDSCRCPQKAKTEMPFRDQRVTISGAFESHIILQLGRLPMRIICWNDYTRTECLRSMIHFG